MKEVDIVDSGYLFNEGIKDWIESVNKALKKELTKENEDFSLRFEKINLALTLFAPIAEVLPIDQAKWYHGENGVLPRSSSTQIIMEFLTQALYMEASHLWPAANHSARCALEHTFWTIWQIGYPKESKTKIGGPKQARFSEMKDAVFEIPRFSKSNEKFELLGDTGRTKNLFEKIQEVYKHLSYYVHTSNIHIEMKGTRPHITHDLKMNPKAERDTKKNFNETFELIVVLLSIACNELIEQKHLTTLDKLLLKDVYTALEEILSKNKKSPSFRKT